MMTSPSDQQQHLLQRVSFTGVILAGGEGRRMGGIDKGLVHFHEKPMVKYVLNALQPVSEAIFICANRNLEEYRAIGACFDDVRVFGDDEKVRQQGPLAGLLSAAQRAASSHLLLSPCDTPAVSSELFAALALHAHQCPQNTYFIQSDGRDHPLHCVVPVAAINALLPGYLARGERRVMGFFNRLAAEPILWGRSEELRNINQLP